MDAGIMQKLQDQGYDLDTIVKTSHRYQKLGWKEIDFSNDGKPKAIVVYPSVDMRLRNAAPAFDNCWNGTILQRIKRYYDTILRITGTEVDLYRALSSASGIQLLILGGHGMPGALTLGAPESQIRTPEREELVISEEDTELHVYLANLARGAVIFLQSCHSKTLVDFFKQQAPHASVIGATRPFSANEIEVRSYIPFDVRIMSTIRIPLLGTYWTDCTYRK